MQSPAPYLEGDAYYTEDSNKSSENEPDESKETRDESLREQLQKTEEEIITLRQVLNVKLKLAQDLKRQLGITAMNEMKDDLLHSINTIKESNTFKATSVVVKNVREKTSSTISNASSRFSQKLGMLRNTNTFKSIEGKMGTAYTSVKKVPCKYNPGDKIFAKVKGFVYWPARVNPLPDDIVIPVNKIPIFFYGTHEVFFITPTSCWPYDEKNKAKWGKPKSRAHFNQGMDEIENKPTIFQYGVDPFAEEFLSQFYEFRKLNGEKSTPKKLNMTHEETTEDRNESEEVAKPRGRKSLASKKRNKSGSSTSFKYNKIDLKSLLISTNEIEQSTIDSPSPQSSRKRQRSGSAMSTKENTDNNIKVEESMENAAKAENNSDKPTSRKRQKSESNEKPESEIKRSTSRKRQKLSIKSEDSITDVPLLDKTEPVEEKKSETDCHADSGSSKPATRCRTKSSNSAVAASAVKPSPVINDPESESGSESPSVDSDNPQDEDFKPIPKQKRLSKVRQQPTKTPTRGRKSEKPPPKKSAPKPPQSQSKAAPKSKPKSKTPIVSSKKKNVDDSDDSLSSISSVEDWKAKDEKQKKDYEEKLKLIQQQQLEMEENAVKEASKKSKEKKLSESLSASNAVDIKHESAIDHGNQMSQDGDTQVKEETKQVKPEPESEPVCQLEKEVVVNIIKTDLSDNNSEPDKTQESSIITEVKEESKTKEASKPLRKTSQSKKVANCPSVAPIESDDEEVDEKNLPESILIEEKEKNKEKEKEKEKEAEKEKKKEKMKEKEKEKEKMKERKSKPLKDLKIPKKSMNKNTNNNSRKRNRKLSSSSSIRSSESPPSSQSISSDSDVEITKQELKPKPAKRMRLMDKNSGSDDNNNTGNGGGAKSSASPDKLIVTLQTFNADIRTSLILGQEDYKTCIDRFRSLCTMEISLQQLVKVWQLMDTVKKCRRYKRNEQVKQEAQSVYKRFMDIYSHASKEEIATSQSLLAQYRHQNNVHNQNVGNDSSKSNGAGSGGPSIPISVADMFQNKPQAATRMSGSAAAHQPGLDANQKPSTKSSVSPTTATVSKTNQASELEINEEKMRLLSADLEAKVSDILNKIEKNVESNPINQKSLSHLLPTTVDEIPIPTEWKPINDNNNDDDDDEDDDVDAIVRRIEEVAIKFPDPPEQLVPSQQSDSSSISANQSGSNVTGTNMSHNHHNHHNHHSNHNSYTYNSSSNVTSNSSALDARIENMFNSSFISVANSSTVTPSVSTKESSRSSTHKKNPRSSTASNSVSSGRHHKKPATSPVRGATESVSQLQSVPTTAVAQVAPTGGDGDTGELQKDDIEIYDLLGV